MLDDATVQGLQRHWDEGWNAGDLATIMAPFAADVVFSSPFVPKLTGDPAKTTIDGYGSDSMRVNAAGQKPLFKTVDKAAALGRRGPMIGGQLASRKLFKQIRG